MTTRAHRQLFALVTLLLTSTGILQAQNGLTAETWSNLPLRESLIVFQQEGISKRAADSTSTILNAKIPATIPGKTGTRLRGFVTPVVTDTYTFWVSGKHDAALWLSDDASRFNKKLIAYHVNDTFVESWDMQPTQKSIAVQLEAGHTYYIEAQVMTKKSSGHIAIAWQGSNGRYALALNGATATQSSTSNGKDASRVIDGNLSGIPANDEVSLTENMANSWIQVDFGQDREINQLVLHNSAANQNRLSNFRLSVLDANDIELAGQDFFTTSGNVGNKLTWDLPASVQGARKVKVQLLGLNLAGNGFLSLAEIEAYNAGAVAGEILNRKVIPSAYLSVIQSDTDDTNDNNLSDAWEAQTGLSSSVLPGALLEYGDPDNDGILNFDEQALGSNPLVKEALANGLTRYLWSNVQGYSVTDLTTFGSFYSYPNRIDHVPGVNDNLKLSHYGTRYRGSIVAPETGDYSFWISADGGGAELWLADGSIANPVNGNPMIDRFGKRQIAKSGGLTPRNDFDYSPHQRSKVVHLVQGQEYYFEVLHAVRYGAGFHVSVAWQAPDGEREIIPATAFLSSDSDANDADDDNLPDTWEVSKNLSPTDNGFIDLNESEYGDPDADGLSNLREYQTGTDPKNADTDGDGHTDGDEVDFYGSDPLTSNNLAPAILTLPALNQYAAATGSWYMNSNGALIANDRRGGITYNFSVSEPGVHEVVLSAAAIHPALQYTHSLVLGLTLDGNAKEFERKSIKSTNGVAGTLRAVTPWLSVGSHSITVYHHNVDSALRLRIDSLIIKRLGGDDLNEDGIPDWLKAKAMLENKLTQIPAESRTSPVSIEGITQQMSSVSLTALAPGASQAEDVPVFASINDGFYADVTLSEAGALNLDAVYVSGLVTESHSITWIATNLFDEFTDETLHIREGDALRLDAWSGTAADAQPFTITLDNVLLADANQNTTHTSGVPFVSTFNTAGSYTLVATHGGQTATVTLEVHAAEFGASHLVIVDTPRTWTPTSLDGFAVVEADSRIVFTETTTTGVRNFFVKADEALNRHVIARLPSDVDGAPSGILARGTVHPFKIAQVNQTGDAQVITQYADGTWLMSNSIVAINMPPNVFIRIQIQTQGTLFTNGSNILELRAEDFDANGIAKIYYEAPSSSTSTKMCHLIKTFIEE